MVPRAPARAERALLVALLAVVVAVSSWPYVEGDRRTPAGHEFTGLVGPYANDQAFYLSWGARQAQDGHLLFEDKFNGHAERRPVFNPLWLAMGWSARLLGLPLIATFHAARLVGGGLLLLVALAWFRRAGLSPAWQLWSLLMLAFGSGLGAYRIPLAEWGNGLGFSALPEPSISPDLWVVESNVFLTLLGECVLPAATALLLWSLRASLDALTGSPQAALGAGARVLLLGTVYPYGVISAWSIVGAMALWRIAEGDRAVRAAARYAAVVAVSMPIVGYDYWLVWSDPKLTVGQALYASPGLAQYAWGFGAFAGLGLAGAALAWRARDGAGRALVVWAAATLLQIYLPLELIPFQLQLVLGVQVPLVALSAKALAAVSASLSGRAGRTAATLALVVLSALACGTSAFHWLDARAGLRRGGLPEYLPGDVAAALRFLDAHAADEQVVLAAPRVSPFVSLVAGTRMFTADYQAPTADYPRKAAFVESLAAADAAARGTALVQALRNEGVAYVLCEPELRRLGRPGLDARLEALPGLRRVFANAEARVYEVLPRDSANQSQAPAAAIEIPRPIASEDGS